jgi:DNA-binding MarR family transcriptional regulator
MTIRDSNYITILAPMITRLKLKGNELLVFALIHGFSQDGKSRFKGSLKYLIEWTGLDKTTVIKILKSLVEKRYINKFEYEKNKVRFCEYSTNYWEALEWLENPTTPPVEKSNHPGCEIPPPPRLENPTTVVGKSNPILNTDIDNSLSIDKDNPANDVVEDLFPDEQLEVQNDKKKTTIFRNSGVFKLVKGNDYSEFEKLFATPEFAPVDLIYYFHSVADWSDTKIGVKRNFNGWVATVRNFIRGDVEKKKVHVKPEHQAPQNKLNVSGAMEFLKDYD